MHNKLLSKMTRHRKLYRHIGHANLDNSTTRDWYPLPPIPHLTKAEFCDRGQQYGRCESLWRSWDINCIETSGSEWLQRLLETWIIRLLLRLAMRTVRSSFMIADPGGGKVWPLLAPRPWRRWISSKVTTFGRFMIANLYDIFLTYKVWRPLECC